jgi:ABC-type uncharacterized transport system permease subunit
MIALVHAIRRCLPSVMAVMLCLLLLLCALAWAGFGREEGETFSTGARKIAAVVWNRSILPSPVRAGGASKETYRSWIQTLLAATPILLTGLTVAVAFRAGVLNIGGEGQYLLGAIAAAVVGLHTRVAVIPSLLLSGFFAGALWAGIAGILESFRKVPVVLSTLLLNFVAAMLLKTLLQGPLHEAGDQLQGEQLPAIARLPHVFLHDRPTQLHVGLFAALGCAVLISGILRYTTFGFYLRATGENPIAARFAGLRVRWIAVTTLCLSGGLAGLAGAIQISGVLPYQLLPDTASSGFGFAGVAVALLGGLAPGGVVLAALFFGWLQTAFSGLETELHVPFVTLQATQGAILIAMLMVTKAKWIARFGGQH